jgi:hypothetical protein
LREGEYSHVVMVIVALLLLTLERLVADVVVELVKLNNDEISGSVAPTRTAMMKLVLGTWVPVKVDFI